MHYYVVATIPEGSRMKTLNLMLAAAVTVLIISSDGFAQQTPFDRLSPELLDVVPPSARVSGALGEMSIRQTSCETRPTTDVRRRIVDVAVQEWGFFGFNVVDQTIQERRDPRTPGTRGRRPRLNAAESARIADSIGGYWAVTPDGSWIIDRQNGRWNGSASITSRWRDAWSAAFVSWVMCEGGLGDRSQFRRAIAHHTYIDQAIRARDGGEPQAAFTAYDAGEAAIEPGDLLCTGSRPGYRTIAERRRQMGVGARTHCDIVVKVDNASERILTIGGNVGGSVTMKLQPATRTQDNLLRPLARGRRPVFAHLKLRADSIEADALDNSPTIKAAGCTAGFEAPPQLGATNLTFRATQTNLC